MPEPILGVLRERLAHHGVDVSSLADGVWRRTGALNTWGTNAIEGNTLSYADVQQLLLEERSVPGRPLSDIIETVQHERAFRSLLDRRADPITLVTVLELHEEVFRGSTRHRAGQWRRSNVFIAGTVHRPPRWHKVLPLMEAWEASANDPGRDAFGAAARSHLSFEQIHPFEDGNGRAGRLVMNLQLMRAGWPPIHVTPEDREVYLDALEQGNRDNLAPLYDFLQAAMARSLLDLLDQVGDDGDRLRPLAEFAGYEWCPFDARYLALRCAHGALAGVRVTNTSAGPEARRRAGRPRWLTSEVALRHYLATKARI